MKIAIGSDHGGFALKEAVRKHLEEKGYEVDDFVRSKAAGYEQFFAPRAEKPGKYLLDLWGYNREVLLDAGLKAENILTAGVCTEHNHEMFCSYRAEQGKTGRMGVCLYRMSDNKNA